MKISGRTKRTLFRVGAGLIGCSLIGCLSLVREGEKEWRILFDGMTLDGWKESEFGGEDEVHIEEGQVVLDFGAAELSGVTCTAPVPIMDYEVSLDAMRLGGHDFFCGLTFPVGESFCSLIVGGWGGEVVGISSFDGLDASENETTRNMSFENEQWYRIKLRVTEDRIEAWIDGEKVVDARTAGRRISIRPEVEPSKPFGIAAWNTRAALRDIRIRSLRSDPTFTRPSGFP